MIFSKEYREVPSHDGNSKYTTFSGMYNGVKFDGQFDHESSYSWKDRNFSGLSDDGWRKEYSDCVNTHVTKYQSPYLRRLMVGREVCYTDDQKAQGLLSLGLTKEELWEMVDSHS